MRRMLAHRVAARRQRDKIRDARHPLSCHGISPAISRSRFFPSVPGSVLLAGTYWSRVPWETSPPLPISRRTLMRNYVKVPSSRSCKLENVDRPATRSPANGLVLLYSYVNRARSGSAVNFIVSKNVFLSRCERGS